MEGILEVAGNANFIGAWGNKAVISVAIPGINGGGDRPW